MGKIENEIGKPLGKIFPEAPSKKARRASTRPGGVFRLKSRF